MRRLAVLFVLAAVLSGCSSKEPGTPSAADQTSSAPTTGTSTRSTPVNRPKAVDLAPLDPCTLVTPETKTALAIRTVAPGTPDKDYGDGSRACGASFEDRKYVWGLNTVLNGGVDRLKRTSGEANLTEVKVAGYPGYVEKRQPQGQRQGACLLYVDANDGQLLLVTMILPLTAGDGSTVDGACERAKTLADAVGAALAK